MYRVLLVDDDLIVRMFLKDVLQWEKLGFEVAGDARDGEEALEMAQKYQPDLILTDISMPRMNGVELVRRLREQGYDGVLIVLSCHDDFELVKSALQSGADEYLLKNHISEDSVGVMMEKIRIQVERRRQSTQTRRQMQTLAREGQKSHQRSVLAQLLSGVVQEEELPVLLQEAGLEGRYRRCALVLFQPIGADSGQMRRLMEQCTQEVDADIVELSPSIGVAIAELSHTPSLRMQKERVGALCACVSRLAARQLVMAASRVCEGSTALAQALQQAYAAFQGGFYQPGLYQYGEYVMPETIPPEAAAFQKKLDALLTQGEPGALEAAYRQALQAFADNKTHPGSVCEWLRSCDRTAGVRRKERFYASLQYFSQYDGCVAEYLAQQAETQRQQVPETAGAAVREAARYIRTHYQEPIGLGHAARAVGLAPTYLSARFKKEMGVGFAEYLLDTRLAHVKRGLQDSSVTVKALSEQAGFADYQHFCKTFKKKVGVSPRAYRSALDKKA